MDAVASGLLGPVKVTVGTGQQLIAGVQHAGLDGAKTDTDGYVGSSR
jgi:hypothetical protein